MSTNDLFTALSGFLGALLGGGILALLEWFKLVESDRARLRVEYVADQISKLYGPLNFWVAHNVQLARHNDSLNGAYNKVYGHSKWSGDPDTQARLQEETTASIEVMNKYTEAVVENNRRIVDLIRDNYGLADDDDQETFQKIVLDVTRIDIEASTNAQVHLPLRMSTELGPIIIFSSEFTDRLRSKCNEKTERLCEHRQPWIRQMITRKPMR